MNERDWSRAVAEKFHNHLKGRFDSLAADVAQRLCYANEVRQYRAGRAECHEVDFETDILIYEWVDAEVWKPRVVIETKIGGVTTHDAITYSRKAESHKAVHPFLRYGMFLGSMGEAGVPARVLRHGENFDFMIAWKGHEAEGSEWELLCDILEQEVEASRLLEDALFNNRSRSRARHSAYHRPLVVR